MMHYSRLCIARGAELNSVPSMIAAAVPLLQLSAHSTQSKLDRCLLATPLGANIVSVRFLAYWGLLVLPQSISGEITSFNEALALAAVF